MRTADVCPTCSTYTNALCVIFDGPLLTTLDIAPNDDLDTALVKIEAWAAGLTLTGGANISDEAYSATWDGNTLVGASKNALYDKINAIDTELAMLGGFAIEQTIKVSVTALNIKMLGDTPVPVPITVSAGEQIVVKDILYIATYTAPAHDTNPLVVGYVGGGDVDATVDLGFTSDINRYAPVSAYDGTPNAQLEIRGTNSVATGNSPVDVYITYQLLTL